jgi:plastocyanin
VSRLETIARPQLRLCRAGFWQTSCDADARMKFLAVPVAVVLSLSVASCSKKSGGDYSTPTSPSTPIPAGPTTVLVPAGAASLGQAPGYAPTPLTVAVGTIVTFGNNDNAQHTATSDGPGWNLSLAPGATGTFQFGSAGTFTYHCTLHAFMRGTVVVQ